MKLKTLFTVTFINVLEMEYFYTSDYNMYEFIKIWDIFGNILKLKSCINNSFKYRYVQK